MLATGNQINQLDSYSGETASPHGGIQSFSWTGVAIVNPSSPSREIPFIIPSRQKGREAKRFRIPANAYIHQVAILYPKDLRWENPSNSNKVQIGTTLNDPLNVLLAIDPVATLGAADPAFDGAEIYSKIPGTYYGNHFRSSMAANPSSPLDQPFTSTFPFEGTFANCPILADLGITSGFADRANRLLTSWSPLLLVDPTIAAPTSRSGKKTAFILRVSGQLIDNSEIDVNDFLAGITELG